MKPALALTLIATLLATIGFCGYRAQRGSAEQGHASSPSEQAQAYNITFDRSACLGYCPVFLLMIDVVGNVKLQMPAHADSDTAESEPLMATYVTKIPDSRVQALARKFDSGGFRKLKLDYSIAVTDGPSTTISIDSTRAHWSTQVYMVPCASAGKRWSARTRKDMGITEFVPDVFCDLSEELDEIACEAYQHGAGNGQSHDLKPFSPPKCKRHR